MPRAKTNHRNLRNIRCPQCGKKFQSETNVLQHMNQPMGSCGNGLSSCPLHQTYFNPNVQSAPQVSADTSHSRPLADQTSIGNTCCFRSPSINSRSLPSSPGHNDVGQPSDPGHPDSRFDMDIDKWVDVDPEVPSGKFVEMYEGCSQAFPGGKTFMDKFRQDKHAAKRQENLYFPFVSREEWQFTSWLLCSHLSLSAIDSFLLSLDIVHGTVSRSFFFD
ncbi:hypothetical protein JVU11DRAFT_9810 [Chiua virens]|nr:hypothetical protein JVU11DRAFT_9810 [Chiua virens]